MMDFDKDKRMVMKRRSCWFCAKKEEPDWKNFQSYSWLVSDFGKIAASRVSGVCRPHHRKAVEAIKRGRVMGFVSFISEYSAH
ncbi:MAG: 30S ribosomal protein S18 [Bacteriovoracaceae bacterium]|nr:30S ribosomal protein S18 [Bacteriovoracaceae bacterium]